MADAKVVFETELDTSGLKSGMSKLEGSGAGSLSDMLLGALGGGNVIQKIGAVLGKAISSSMVVAFAKAAGDIGVAFNEQFAQVSAVMGYYSEDLRNLAIKAGDETQYTATEAAAAMHEMALAGWEEQQIIEGFYDVLNLATIGNMDFAHAGEVVTNIMNAYGLEVSEISTLIDQMAMADIKASTSVAELARGFLSLGGTAKNLAGGTIETATALALLSDNGIKAAQSGTQLRNIIIALGAPGDKASGALDALSVSAYDAEGNFRPLIDTFSDLRLALAFRPQESQIQLLDAIFNKYDLKSVNALLGTSTDRWQELTNQIANSAGTTKTMYGLLTDTAAHDLKELESAQETFMLKTYDVFGGAHRGIIQAQTALTRGLTGFVFGGEGSTIDTSALTDVDMSMQLAELAESAQIMEAFAEQRQKMLEEAENDPTIPSLLEILFPSASAEEMPDYSPDGEGSAIANYAQHIIDALSSGLELNGTNFATALQNVLDGAETQADTSGFEGVGKEISNGIASGIRSGSGAVAAAVRSVIATALAEAQKAAKIHSPSRLFRDKVGAMIASGTAEGVSGNAYLVRDAVGSMVNHSIPNGIKTASKAVPRIASMEAVGASKNAKIEVPQTVNFNVPYATPDEVAKTMQMYMTYGLAAE